MEHSLINEIAVCIIAAWGLAVVAQFLRQPLILAYLVAGFAAGPVGFGWIRTDEHIEVISEIGLSLLLFMIGLEINLKQMLRSGRIILGTATVQILGACVLGLVCFGSLGLPLRPGRLDAFYLAVAAALSSTVIIVKLLYDKRELDTLAGRITVGVLLLQDLFAILFLAVQPNLDDPSVVALAVSLGKVLVLVLAAFLISRFLLPPLFRSMARVPEVVLVGALAWCFLMAGLAHQLGLSREMGALIAGVAFSTFPYTLEVTAKVTSLRDFFVTLFFVSLGMKIPAPTWPLLGWAAVLVVFVVVSRFLTVTPMLHRLGLGHRASLLPSIHLSQLSEFSLVILVLGVEARHIGTSTLESAAYAFAILAVLSSNAILKSDSLTRRLGPVLGRLGFPDLAHGIEDGPVEAHGSRIMLLGCFTTGSSLLTEIERQQPGLLPDVTVLDFNPLVNERLRQRGIRVVYGDIGKRETLVHAGVGAAEILVCTLPGSILQGTSNSVLIRQLREINPDATILATGEQLGEVAALYEAGADYVCIPRIAAAGEFLEALSAAGRNELPALKARREAELTGRNEAVP